MVWQAADLTGLASMPLGTEQRYIGLPVDHHLAGHEHLAAADIAGIALGWTR